MVRVSRPSSPRLIANRHNYGEELSKVPDPKMVTVLNLFWQCSQCFFVSICPVPMRIFQVGLVQLRHGCSKSEDFLQALILNGRRVFCFSSSFSLDPSYKSIPDPLNGKQSLVCDVMWALQVTEEPIFQHRPLKVNCVSFGHL